ncbi:MAG: class I SAM-dependent methyltransferase [Candidatus Competibacteraceae bacterium]|nr:class I SAM-dependent methyltransferase [Candidatus Competibacteraceae bacterium]
MTSIQLFSPAHWTDYELIDCGGFEKLERFGSFITVRPEPQAIWDKQLTENEWRHQAHVKFIGTSSNSGRWEKWKNIPDNWLMEYRYKKMKLQFNLALTGFKHVGIFPEQAINWDYIFDTIKKIQSPQPRFLNLFAYTGGASLAAKAAGADVVHVDAIKQVVSWANRNMESSRLHDIRWVVEDAMKFVKREIKRGKSYHGIILDPPAFGHGPQGESWKLEKQINELVKDVLQLLDKEQFFIILNTYSLGFSSLIIQNMIQPLLPKYDLIPTRFETGELFLSSNTQLLLPLGVMARIDSLN